MWRTFWPSPGTGHETLTYGVPSLHLKERRTLATEDKVRDMQRSPGAQILLSFPRPFPACIFHTLSSHHDPILSYLSILLHTQHRNIQPQPFLWRLHFLTKGPISHETYVKWISVPVSCSSVFHDRAPVENLGRWGKDSFPPLCWNKVKCWYILPCQCSLLFPFSFFFTCLSLFFPFNVFFLIWPI